MNHWALYAPTLAKGVGGITPPSGWCISPHIAWGQRHIHQDLVTIFSIPFLEIHQLRLSWANELVYLNLRLLQFCQKKWSLFASGLDTGSLAFLHLLQKNRVAINWENVLALKLNIDWRQLDLLSGNQF